MSLQGASKRWRIRGEHPQSPRGPWDEKYRLGCTVRARVVCACCLGISVEVGINDVMYKATRHAEMAVTFHPLDLGARDGSSRTRYMQAQCRRRWRHSRLPLYLVHVFLICFPLAGEPAIDLVGAGGLRLCRETPVGEVFRTNADHVG